jgi:hypothetical protein
MRIACMPHHWNGTVDMPLFLFDSCCSSTSPSLYAQSHLLVLFDLGSRGAHRVMLKTSTLLSKIHGYLDSYLLLGGSR